MLVAAGTAAWLTTLASGAADRPVRYVGVMAVVAVAVSLVARVFAGVGAGIIILGGCYATILVADDPPLDARAAVLGAVLLVVGELASLSLGTRAAVTEEAGAALGRVAWVAALAVGATILGGAVMAIADLLRASGTVIEVVGVAAALAAIALLAAAARAARADAP